eukprot:612493-Rhodomonas_salina.1
MNCADWALFSAPARGKCHHTNQMVSYRRCFGNGCVVVANSPTGNFDCADGSIATTFWKKTDTQELRSSLARSHAFFSCKCTDQSILSEKANLLFALYGSPDARKAQPS